MRRAWIAAALAASSGFAGAAHEGELTLDRCLELARSEHPDLLSRRADVEAGEAGVKQARAGFFPSVEASVGADLWRRTPSGPLEGVLPGTDVEPRSSIGASWRVFGVKNPLEYSRALNRRDEARGELVDDELRLDSAVVGAYYDLLEAQMVLDLRGKLYALQLEEYELVIRRMKMGSASSLAGLSGEDEVLDAEASLLQAETERRRASAELSVLVGEAVDPGRRLESLNEEPMPDPGSEEEWISAGRANRGDLQARRAAVRATKRSVALALWERLPDINVGVQYSLNPDPFYGVGRRPFRTEVIDEEASWAFGVGMNVPIFSGGLLSARHEQARASLVRAKNALDLAERQLARDVRSAWARYASARSLRSVRRRQLEIAEERLDQIERLYRAGARYQKVDASRARTDRARREVSYVQASVEAREAWVRLLRSAGLDLDAEGPATDGRNDEEG